MKLKIAPKNTDLWWSEAELEVLNEWAEANHFDPMKVLGESMVVDTKKRVMRFLLVRNEDPRDVTRVTRPLLTDPPNCLVRDGEKIWDLVSLFGYRLSLSLVPPNTPAAPVKEAQHAYVPHPQEIAR